MILKERTLQELHIDITILSNNSAKRVYFQCDSCGSVRLKQYRDCIKGSGLCIRCFRVKMGKMMGDKFGKAQKKQGICHHCGKPCPYKNNLKLQFCKTSPCKDKQAIINRKIKSERFSGDKNPAWVGRYAIKCTCGKDKSHGAKQCRTCSFRSGSRSGSKNGRWVRDRDLLAAAKVMRAILKRLEYPRNEERYLDATLKLGYTIEQFKTNIESQFLPWMNWYNRGQKKGTWALDHIIPVSVLIKIGVRDPAIVNALWNLRPLCAISNMRRSNKIDKDAIKCAKQYLNIDLKECVGFKTTKKLKH